MNVFLATADNDDDFEITETNQFDGKSRDRVIAEYELDGVYILRKKLAKGSENAKVKHFGKMIDDLVELLRARGLS